MVHSILMGLNVFFLLVSTVVLGFSLHYQNKVTRFLRDAEENPQSKIRHPKSP